MKKIKKMTKEEVKKILRTRLKIDLKKKRITPEWAEGYFKQCYPDEN